MSRVIAATLSLLCIFAFVVGLKGQPSLEGFGAKEVVNDLRLE